jgi:HlyD family secretion protein
VASISDSDLQPPPPGRRIPGLGVILALLFLVLPIAGVAWYFTRSKTDGPPPGPSLTEIDVVCLGRVDGQKPVVNLDPVVPGKVVALPAVEGKHFEAGQELLKLDAEAFQLRKKEAEAAVAAADIEVQAAKLDQKLHPLRKSTQEAAVTAAADRAAAARRILEEKQKAKSFGTVTAAELIAAEAEVKQAEQLEGVEKSRLKELEAADPSLKVRAADVKKTIAEIALKQAEKAVRDCVVVAPSAGTVLRVQVSVGEGVAPGVLPPIVFRPDGPLVVRAELEQEFLSRVRPGMKATVRDEVRPDSPTWTGKVVSVGQVVARRRTLLLEPGEMNDVRTVECVVALEGNTEGLLVGQRMRVRIGHGE